MMLTASERYTLTDEICSIESDLAKLRTHVDGTADSTAQGVVLIGKTLTVIARALVGTVPSDDEMLREVIHGPEGIPPS